MYYEISVSQHHIYFFSTHKRSITTLNKLNAIRKEFEIKFPESEGYEIVTMQMESRGVLIPKKLNLLP